MRTKFLAAAACVAFGLATTASGGFTTILDSGETTLAEILTANTVFSVGLADLSPGVGQVVATDGSSTLYRIHDNDTGIAGGTINLDGTGVFGVGPLGTDNVWSDGTVTAAFVDSFAGFDQNFGITSDVSDIVDGTGTFTGTVDPVTLGSVITTPLLPDEFEWLRFGQSAPEKDGSDFTSDASANLDSQDHMVSFFWDVDGDDSVGIGDKYILAFEDLLETNIAGLNDPNTAWDQDYNDLVVSISIVPEPGAILLGLIGCGVISAARRRFA